ncbi:MAG: short chain enoyl-CoA hydratase [Candidatus Solibacter sp.]|jgi:enoyl-CoA hydratase/carnithine racemase|nr:short chain enoyl-CoA hydratase [Candidatus Solibacter sp.]
MTDLLHSVREGRVLRLTLNRPDKRNALDAALCAALTDALEAADRDPAIGAILLAANGNVFCAGMDLAEIESGIATSELNAVHERLFTVGVRLTTPIVAAVHGPALGGGTGLVANCHIVVAGPEAAFGLTEIRLAIWPFLIYRAVAAAVGDRRTLELALTGRIFDSAEAHEMVLVHELHPDTVHRALEIARRVAGFSPIAIHSGMSFVQQMKASNPQDAGAIAQTFRNELFTAPDFKEGIRAFLEKRPPHWPSLPKTELP